MRKFIITCLAVPFIIFKVAFLYKDDSHIKHTIAISQAVEPTYRISAQLNPDLRIKISAALSEINRDGTVTPIFILKTPTF